MTQPDTPARKPTEAELEILRALADDAVAAAHRRRVRRRQQQDQGRQQDSQSHGGILRRVRIIDRRRRHEFRDRLQSFAYTPWMPARLPRMSAITSGA